METKIGKYIQQQRKKKGMSIRQLALYSKVSHGHLSHIERGIRKTPSPEILRKIAKPLNVPYEELMTIAGHLPDTQKTKQKMERILANDPELFTLVNEICRRKELQSLL